MSNPQRPEYGQVTVPFPIPSDQYDQTIEMLQATELGFSVNRDCIVDEIDSQYSVLGALKDTMVNVDQLDYLAKRLDSFCVGEVSQFQAMAHKLEIAHIKDFINLTFCCQQATVITDFSDLDIVMAAEVMRMARKKLPGHFCKVCGMRKSNESFSGKGHAAHICKACSRLSPAQQAEQMTLRRLENLPLRRLTESEMKWLKNRTHDHRPEVKDLACMVYAERFPRLARNQKKQELFIQTLTLSIDGDICDPYGDPVYLKESYQVSRTPPSVICIQQDGTSQAIEPPPKILAKLLKWTVHTLEIFWWGEDYCDPADVELEEDALLWSVHVEYSNGEIQYMGSADNLPDHVLELLFALAELFE